MLYDPISPERLDPALNAPEQPKAGLMPGVIALMIFAAIGAASVLPARALVFPGLGFAEVTGSVGGQADSRGTEPCNVGAALSLGLAPVCAMTLP